MKDIITGSPETDKYETIKQALIQRLTISQEHKTRQFLEHKWARALGDRKLSQFLRDLRSLTGTNIPDILFQMAGRVWLGRLPQ